VPIDGVEPADHPIGCYGKMRERSIGKDTTTGHWELMGIILEQPFPTYPDGFPNEIIEEIEIKSGRKTIGNKAASGTEILKEQGEQHKKTGYPIIYTSADSVLQIAAHEDVIPVEELYRICEIARGVCSGKHAVGRIIARPFVGEGDNYVRTGDRKDFSLVPPFKTTLELMTERGLTVWAVGKIEDVFANRGITKSNHTKDNRSGMQFTTDLLREDFQGLVFTNLVDFDSQYGHRNDPVGFAQALEEFDTMLPALFSGLTNQDMLMIVADHGCDPTTQGSDHTREYVPLLVYGPALKAGIDLGVRESFADVGATLEEIFGLPRTYNGTSFWAEVYDACC
jgi:phosphopentomutase